MGGEKRRGGGKRRRERGGSEEDEMESRERVKDQRSEEGKGRERR